MLNKLRRIAALSVLSLCALTAVSAAASTANAEPPGARKAEAPGVTLHVEAVPGANLALAAAAPLYRNVATVWTDANYQGWGATITGKNWGDCDRYAYHYTFGWGSQLRQTSSISKRWESPNCNAAEITTTFGGHVGMCLPKSYVGAAANDQVAELKVYFNRNCPR